MNNKEIQEHLIRLRLLDPKADGAWGAQSKLALSVFQKLAGLTVDGVASPPTLKALEEFPSPQLKLGNDFASRVIRYMVSKNYWVPVGEGAYTIVYVEGCEPNGVVNADEPNEWNDRRIVIEIEELVPRIVGNWQATTEPGTYYTENPLNPRGCARIAFGQYQAWIQGYHGRSQYPALEQAAPVKIFRDGNADYTRTGDYFEEGVFGINQHHGWNCPLVEENSAGCLVGQSIAGHQDFIKLLRGDRRYRANPGYLYYTAILDGSKL